MAAHTVRQWQGVIKLLADVEEGPHPIPNALRMGLYEKLEKGFKGLEGDAPRAVWKKLVQHQVRNKHGAERRQLLLQMLNRMLCLSVYQQHTAFGAGAGQGALAVRSLTKPTGIQCLVADSRRQAL